LRDSAIHGFEEECAGISEGTKILVREDTEDISVEKYSGVAADCLPAEKLRYARELKAPCVQHEH